MKVSMAVKELQRASVLEQIKNKVITCTEAAAKLGISIRQVFRSRRRYRESGAAGLAHKSRGKESSQRMDREIEAKILELLRTKYENFGPTFAGEKLESLDNILVSKEWLRQLMLKNGLWQKKRKRRTSRKWRPRKEYFGQLVQLDGSEHRWFSGSDQMLTLIAFIDDATSRILHASMCSSESTENVMQATKSYFLEHGKPLALYTDRGSAYKVNTHNPNDDLCTQYERGLSVLEVELIHAYSPQAKGRIERNFGTLQDRLVKELKLADITTIHEANIFIKNTFIPEHNKRFSVYPVQNADLHTPTSEFELDAAFCIVSERIVTNDWTIRYDCRLLQLDNSRPAIVKPKDRVIIHQQLSGELYVTIRNERLAFKDITNENREKVTKLMVDRKPHKPAKDHPWRRTFLTTKNNIYVSQM